jgi:hypothetical protein
MADRLACLEGEREELAALVDVLSRADEVVAKHAISAAFDLAGPHTCLEPNAAHAASRAAEDAGARRSHERPSARRRRSRGVSHDG